MLCHLRLCGRLHPGAVVDRLFTRFPLRPVIGKPSKITNYDARQYIGRSLYALYFAGARRWIRGRCGSEGGFGLVTEVWVQNNTEVQQGQKLFQIDQSQYAIAFNQAKSDLETTQRLVDAVGAMVRSARANLLFAQANLVKAQKDTTRLEALRASDWGRLRWCKWLQLRALVSGY